MKRNSAIVCWKNQRLGGEVFRKCFSTIGNKNNARAIGDLKSVYESINQTLTWLKNTSENNAIQEIKRKEEELKTLSWEQDRKRHGRYFFI